MNVILSDTRSLLLVQHVSDLMFIRMHGPPLEVWKSDQYVQSWLKKTPFSNLHQNESSCTNI